MQRRGQQVMAPKYVFVTERELERMRMKAKVRAKQKLQMPPQLEPRNDHRNIVLESDPAIQVKYWFNGLHWPL